MKFLSTLFLSAVAVALPALALAEGAAAPKAAAHKTTAKHASASKKKEAAAADKTDEQEPDVASSVPTEIQCELGNKLTIYRQPTNDQEIALRWKKQLRRLTRVQTTTGANRFEDQKSGLVWIDIPAKGMLLDSKKGQQLANECIYANR